MVLYIRLVPHKIFRFKNSLTNIALLYSQLKSIRSNVYIYTSLGLDKQLQILTYSINTCIVLGGSLTISSQISNYSPAYRSQYGSWLSVIARAATLEPTM